MMMRRSVLLSSPSSWHRPSVTLRALPLLGSRLGTYNLLLESLDLVISQAHIWDCAGPLAFHTCFIPTINPLFFLSFFFNHTTYRPGRDDKPALPEPETPKA